jgi:hypothetical protein
VSIDFCIIADADDSPRCQLPLTTARLDRASLGAGDDATAWRGLLPGWR